jgi:calcium-translocating P-type ATPase
MTTNGNNHEYPTNGSIKDTLSVEETKAQLESINEAQAIDRNLKNLKSIGGISGLLSLLQTNPECGIESTAHNSNIESEVQRRRNLYGSNAMPSTPRKSFLQLLLGTFDDDTLQILIAAAVVSLAVGLYEDPSSGYVEGLAILSAVIIVSNVTAINDYQKESQFRALSKANDDVEVLVVRDGKHAVIPIDQVVVGDLLTVEAGNKIPCDGVLIHVDDLRVDESSLTGEPLDVKKSLSEDPFLLSGCLCTTGTATFVAIAVGKDSQWGKIQAALEKEHTDTPLQEKLDHMAQLIGNVGIAAAAATFLAMMFIKLVIKPEHLANVSIFSHALEAFIICVTIVVVAVPEGLPLAVTISLAYSTKKMLTDNNLIRHLAACETMGNATNICSDKTGTLTQNRMTVVSGLFANQYYDDTLPESNHHISISEASLHHILQCIATCSTARIIPHKSIVDPTCDVDTRPLIIGNKTEAALLLLASSSFFKHDDYESRRRKAMFGKPHGSRLFPFSSTRKCMTVLIKHEPTPNSEATLYHKGAGEIVLQKCTLYLDSDGSVHPITPNKRLEFEAIISKFAKRALRCIALAHRPSIHTVVQLETVTEELCRSTCENHMILDALVGIIDPLRPDVIEAVETCQKAGIIVRMVTGDNLDTAQAIAKEAGIFTDGGISMIGEEFRKLTPSQLDAILPKLQVLARSSPEDKHILVQRLNGGLMPKTEEEWLQIHPGKNFATLKDKLLPGYYDEWAESRGGVGEVVGVTGDGTNDGPALTAADVGLSMGISGTDVAKNASDIIIMDDNFSSIVKAVLWGRSVFDNIRKFLQFQLTVNVVALSITFLSAVCGYKPPLNAVMMLWVNLIMDTMGALALGTEPPTLKLLNRRPYKRDASLVSLPMWRNILVQASYQLSLLVFLLRRGPEIFGCEDGSVHHFTLIFNAFVFCQVFNEFNAREIGDAFLPFKNLHTSPMFMLVIILTVLFQWVIIQYGGDFTQTSPLTFLEWKVTILLGFVSIPIGYLMRLIPVQEDPNAFAGIDSSGPYTTSEQKNNKVSFAFAVLVVPIVAMVLSLIFPMINDGKWII